MWDRFTVEASAARMRMDIVEMIAAAGSGHPGGSLSAADIVATLYFGDVLRHDPNDPDWPERDRFILSKGHAGPVLYAALAEAGYFGRDHLATLRKLGSILQGHPDSKKTPGVEVSTGSLGQGLSVAAGLAAGLGSNPDDDRTVFCLLGDGELQEGQVWEAAMFSAHHGLSNLVAIVDDNGLQIDGACNEVMCLGRHREQVLGVRLARERVRWSRRRGDPLGAARGAQRTPTGPPSSSHTPSKARACRSWRTRPAGTARRRPPRRPRPRWRSCLRRPEGAVHEPSHA